MDLAKLNRWTFRSETLGELQISPLSLRVFREIEPYLSGDGSSETAPEDFVRVLLSVVAQRPGCAEDGEELSHLGRAEVDLLSAEELEAFSDEFYRKDASLQSKEPREEGGALLLREDGESSANFLFRCIKQKHEEMRKRLRKTVDKMGVLKSSVEQSSALKDVAENISRQGRSFSDYLYRTRKDISQDISKVEVSENPVNETNRKLGVVVDRFDRLIDFGENALSIMTGLQAAAAEFLDQFSIEAEKNNKAAHTAIGVGILAVVISIAQVLYTEFWRVPQDTRLMDEYFSEMRREVEELRSAQLAALERLATALQRSSQDEVLERLIEVIERQDANSEQLLEAISRLTENLEASEAAKN